ncbi:hypothetical protein IHQ72_32155 [Mesorhizobium onobrychidis]|uniref:Uncharacterized protein n=2 Tax=Mesorhizobium onobrychidis TaxID=2775404 RepID=A0ABY5RAC6_9HYPH|nr:hypothetical protein IHQ72_32155 [Mesorhizobium onobrychidis]
MDRVVVAGLAVLDHYASLSPSPALARSTMPDRKVRQCCDVMLVAVENHCKLTEPTRTKLEAYITQSLEMVRELKSRASPDQVTKMYLSVAKAHVAQINWWEKRISGCERQRYAAATRASLPNPTADIRRENQILMRRTTGELMLARFALGLARIDSAHVKIESQEGTFEPAVREILMFKEGRLPLLDTFVDDVAPAFTSAVPAVRDDTGRPLDADHCAVLEGVVKRLSEFEAALLDMHANLSDQPTSGGLPLELLDEIAKDASITADHVGHLLALQPDWPAIVAPPADTGAGIPAAAPRKGKGKGKSKQAAGASTSVAGASNSAVGQQSPQIAAGVKDPAPAAKVLIRTNLGTKKLLSAEQAQKSAEEAQKSAEEAAARLETWHTPPAKEEMLTPLLARLTELLQFDLAGLQSKISQARKMSPEDAEHIADTVVDRLQTQAAEMEACLAAFKEPRLLLLLSSGQIPKFHKDKEQLNNMLSQAQGLAKALNEQPIAIDCMKTYALPSQKYLEQLRTAGELITPGQPYTLHHEPGSLFEIRLQPKALHNGTKPSPMWVHIHTKRPVYARQLATLDTAEFAACHVKSNQQRGHNRQWEEARAATHESVAIHRGKLTPAFCKSLLTT